MTGKSQVQVNDGSGDKATITLPGIVQKIIPSFHPSQPEQAQIAVDGAQDLYREIRIDNKLEDSEGHTVKLKPGAEVEVKIEAPPDATTPVTPVQFHTTKDGLGQESEKEKAKKKPS